MLIAVMVYSRRVLRLSSGIDDMGPVMWDLALSLIGAWVLTFLTLFKGIKVSGKVRTLKTAHSLLHHGMVISFRPIYQTADEADAYMFYIMFFCFFFCFSVRQKYETTVLGNG